MTKPWALAYHRDQMSLFEDFLLSGEPPSAEALGYLSVAEKIVLKRRAALTEPVDLAPLREQLRELRALGQ